MKTWNQTLILLCLEPTTLESRLWVLATHKAVYTRPSAQWQALHNISECNSPLYKTSLASDLINWPHPGKIRVGAFMTFCKYWHIITSHTLKPSLLSFPSCQTASATWCYFALLWVECFGSIFRRPRSGHTHNIDSMTTRYPASVWVKPVTLKDNLNWQELPRDLFCLNLTTSPNYGRPIGRGLPGRQCVEKIFLIL